jgi:hypothetical protein
MKRARAGIIDRDRDPADRIDNWAVRSPAMTADRPKVLRYDDEIEQSPFRMPGGEELQERQVHEAPICWSPTWQAA